jgi:DNA-binding transcriptional LysR family regulator
MDEGSVNRTANRLAVAQPTLTRQIQALEQEIGAPLFERGSCGVRPTDLAYRLREQMVPLMKAFDLAWADLTAHAQGRQAQLRIGYLRLSAARLLTPALGRFRENFPDIKLWLFDQTPREQLTALRDGKLDLALIGQEGAGLTDEFYCQRIARLGVCAALPSNHPLARQQSLSVSRLAKEGFIVPSESAVPSRERWLRELCRKAGFGPRIIARTKNVAETFALVVGEQGVAILPDYLESAPPPGVVFVRLSDRFATWDFLLLRQRGRLSPACRDLIKWIREQALLH